MKLSDQQNNYLGSYSAQSIQYRKILNKFPYDSGTLWLHQDIRFMPEKKKDWSPIHYQINKDLSHSMFSVWVNPIEPTITHHDPILQTWEPIFEPKSEKVIVKVPMVKKKPNIFIENKKNKLTTIYDIKQNDFINATIYMDNIWVSNKNEVFIKWKIKKINC